jgi:hypothetical protein
MKSAALVHSMSAAIVVLALAAWLATGREAFTRWPNARLEAADAPVSESEQDLLGEIGIDAAPSAESAAFESRFAFGLVPSGADPAHLLSLATTIALAALLSGGVLVAARIRRATDS